MLHRTEDGGRVESPALVDDTAHVYSSGVVKDGAVVRESAQIWGTVEDYARIRDRARIRGRVSGTAQVGGYADVSDSATVREGVVVHRGTIAGVELYGAGHVVTSIHGPFGSAQQFPVDVSTMTSGIAMDYDFCAYPFDGTLWLTVGCQAHRLEDWERDVRAIVRQSASYSTQERAEAALRKLFQFLRAVHNLPKEKAVKKAPAKKRAVKKAVKKAPKKKRAARPATRKRAPRQR